MEIHLVKMGQVLNVIIHAEEIQMKFVETFMLIVFTMYQLLLVPLVLMVLIKLQL